MIFFLKVFFGEAIMRDDRAFSHRLRPQSNPRRRRKIDKRNGPDFLRDPILPPLRVANCYRQRCPWCLSGSGSVPMPPQSDRLSRPRAVASFLQRKVFRDVGLPSCVRLPEDDKLSGHCAQSRQSVKCNLCNTANTGVAELQQQQQRFLLISSRNASVKAVGGQQQPCCCIVDFGSGNKLFLFCYDWQWRSSRYHYVFQAWAQTVRRRVLPPGNYFQVLESWCQFHQHLRAAFTPKDSKSAKKTVKSSSFLRFWDLRA